MGSIAYLKDVATVAAILTLLLAGLLIALRSGDIAVDPARPRFLTANFSRLILTVAAGLLGLGVIQQVVGFRLSMI